MNVFIWSNEYIRLMILILINDTKNGPTVTVDKHTSSKINSAIILSFQLHITSSFP